MFYSQFILAKKGPLGTIWIAAHLDRKLRKNQVADTDIGVSVDSIICPEIPIALRLSSHLLLGVVRIYSKKVNYLFDDCSEALLKVKQAFRSEAVDLPPEQSKAPYHSITLPETFDLDDFELPDTDVINGSFVDHHVSAREQITLQDPMEGVVFTTSQFGLDECFGDGDTFQIGLDLDEDLLLDKGESSGQRKDIMDTLSFADSSVELSSLLKDAKSDEEMNESSATTEANFFTIQAPSTPGLAAEPTLPIGEDAQVSDDHMEEDQNSTEVVTRESPGADFSKPESYSVHIENVSSTLKVHDHMEFKKAFSHQFPPLEDQLLKIAPPEHTQLPVENQNSLSNSSEEAGALKPQAPKDEGLTALTCSESIEVHEDGVMRVGLSIFADDQCPTHEAAGAPLELTACCPCSSVGDVVCDNGKAFAKSGVFDSVEDSSNIRDNTSQLGNTDSLDRRKSGQHESADGGSVSSSEPLLQACSSHHKDADASSDLMSSHPACCSISGVEHHNLDRQAVSLVPSDSIRENETGVPFSDLPSSEKLLIIPEEGRINALLQSTPETKSVTEGDEYSTVNILTGRKRSFIESAVTFPSVTSVEYSAAAQSNKSLELVPNDDDLLSSILVGRRSTVLKLKPTPSIQDVDSMKRRRVAPRTTPYKRKVLMDDIMVLHGDTIRQQLINTEDIRRLRKKAPCTGSEIWVLQKQLLEDEIFSDPFVSGMSADLISLHSQPFDLRRINIVVDEVSSLHMEAHERGSSLRPEDEINAIDTDSVDRDIINGLEENVNEQCNKAPSGPQPSQRDASQEDPDIEIEGRSIPVGDEAGNLVASAENLSSVPSMVLEEDDLKDHTTVSTSLAKPEDAELSFCNDVVNTVQTDQMLQSTEQGMDLQTTCTVSATDVSAIKSNDGEKLDTNLSKKSNKGELVQRTDEDWVREQMEGFDSFAATLGINLDQSLRLDYASVFAAMSPQIRSLAASDQALIDKPADHCESTGGDKILGSKQYEDNALENRETDSRLDCSAVDRGSSIPAKEVNVQLLDANDQSCVDPTFVSDQSKIGDHVLEEFDKENFKHDTDFLNYDDEDDENANDGDNSVPNVEETGMQETIGWSARTRAVANYLQILFHKGAQEGSRVVHLDNLLARKTRKEASRMFFETLVLKTRDYIHVEQTQPFCDISIRPQPQLMKSDF